MTLHPGPGAEKLLRLWLITAGTAVSLLCLAAALRWDLRFLPVAGAAAAITAAATLYYPSRYLCRWQADCTHETLTAARGVFWQRQWRVPLPALCSAVWWDTPCSRRLGCGILVLHHSGGTTLLPFLDAAEAAALLCRWEEAS